MKKANTMCSNCSGDDLSPESFAIFDVSSPKGRQRFAESARGKRKRYGTTRVWAALVKCPLTLSIVVTGIGQWLSQIIGTVDYASFVNLNLGAPSGEGAAKTGISAEVAGLIEIRVSADAIIEVYASFGAVDNPRNEFRLSEGQYLSAWEESCVERSDLQRTMERFRRTRRLKYFIGYGAFLTFAALAVWCAVR